MTSWWPTAECGKVVLILAGPIDREQVRAICERVRRFLEESGADSLVCDVGAVYEPDLITVEVLTRIQLTANRLGLTVRLGRPGRRLQDLLVLVGLDEVIGLPQRSGLILEGESEKREEPFRVEEEVKPGDAAV